MKATHLLSFIILLLFKVNVMAQTNFYGYQWANGNASIEHLSVVTDPSGNVYTLSEYKLTVDADASSGLTSFTSMGDYDVMIIKTSTQGNFLWAKSIGGTGIDRGDEIHVDNYGNIIISGNFTGTADLNPNAAVTNYTAEGNSDVFLIKLDANGNWLWTQTYGGTGKDEIKSFKLNALNEIYMTGNFEGLMDIDPSANVVSLNSSVGQDIFIARLNAYGELNWAKQIGNSDAVYVNDIELNSSDAIHLAGGFKNVLDFDPNATVSILAATDGLDGFVCQLDNNGNFQWAKQWDNANYQHQIHDIAIDQNEQVIVMANFAATIDADPNTNVTMVTNTDQDWFVMSYIVKLSVSGSTIWVKTIPINTPGIKTDALNNMYIQGTYISNFAPVDMDPGPGIFNLPTTYILWHLALVKLDQNAAFQNALSIGKTTGNTFNNQNEVWPQSFDLDASGNIYSIGGIAHQGLLDFNPTLSINELQVNYNHAYYTVKLNPCATQVTASTNQANIIANMSTQLTATGANTYVWQPSNVNGSPAIVYPTTSTTYTVVGTTADGCTNTATTQINVQPTGNVHCNIAFNTVHSGNGIGWNINACGGPTPGQERVYSFTPTVSGMYDLQTNYVLGDALQWMYKNAANGLDANGWTCLANVSTSGAYSFGPLTAGQTYYILADASTTNSSSQFCIIQYQALSPNGISSPICEGSIATLTAQPQGASFQWYTAPIGGNLLSSQPLFTTPQLDQTTTYWLQADVYCGLSSPRVQVTQIVHPRPTVTATASNTKVCKNSTVILNGVGATNYTWSHGASNNTPFPVSTNTTFTVTGTDANSCSNTATIEIDVNELPIIGIAPSQDTICLGDVTMLAGTGGSAYSWTGGIFDQTPFMPTTTTTYTVTGTGSFSCTNTATKTVVVRNCNMNLKLFLQGYYTGNQQMQQVLFNQGIEPYPSYNVDTVVVELHKSFSPYALVETQKGILRVDGTLMLNFNADPTQYYYVVMKHRNHLETWSADAYQILSLNTQANFSINNGKAYGDNQIELEPGVYGFFAGDLNQDGFIDSFDFPALDTDIFNGLSATYVNTDINGDGFVDSFDFPMFDVNNSNGIRTLSPTP